MNRSVDRAGLRRSLRRTAHTCLVGLLALLVAAALLLLADVPAAFATTHAGTPTTTTDDGRRDGNAAYLVAESLPAAVAAGGAKAGSAGEVAGILVSQSVFSAPRAASVADDVVVLGKYPDYINLADDLGARRFNVPDWVWNGMSETEQWAANQRFLDRAIARGSDIRLASRVTPSSLTGAFAHEIEYLTKQGYTISSNGLRMIPPG